MNTRVVAPLLIALAFGLGLPAVGKGQAWSNELAMVILYDDCTGACNDQGPYKTALVFPGGSTGDANDRAPTWSPDGARLAFERNGEILVIDVAGGSPVNITNNSANDRFPAWSPDGARIAFASDRDGQPELYLMNPDGSNVVRLTNSVGFSGRPTWSPDSAKLAFNCVIESGNADICVVNADGTLFARLTTDPASDGTPAWSPDGTRIAFSTSRYPNSPPFLTQLALMNSDGSGVVQVGPGNFESGDSPSWSPDGTRIAFVEWQYCGLLYLQFCPNVHVINVDGTAGPGIVAFGFDPAWRPAAPTAAATIGVMPTSITPGGTVTATWTGIATPTSTDWIGLYVPGASPTAFIEWVYVSCSKTPNVARAAGSCPFLLTSLPSGVYEMRLFANNGYTRLATSAALTVTGSPTGVSLTVVPASVAAGGTLTASWSGIAPARNRDWIGLYRPGSAPTAFIEWIYVSCSKAPAAPRVSGSCPFVLPAALAPGSYELRLLADDGYTQLTISSPFTVTP